MGSLGLEKISPRKMAVVKNEFYLKTHRVGHEAWLQASLNFMTLQYFLRSFGKAEIYDLQVSRCSNIWPINKTLHESFKMPLMTFSEVFE